jgi:O-methyltransferase
MEALKSFIKKYLKKKSQKITQVSDITQEEWEYIDRVLPYTMTNEERLVTLLRACKYVLENDIDGSFVECGVWKGGSSLLIANFLNNNNANNRKLYMYDTFEGMSAPTENDVQYDGQFAGDMLKRGEVICYSSFDEVVNTMRNSAFTNYEMIKGKVEDTIPNTLPQKIALLRLDTDWYESTKHELVHLFPLVEKGGIVIIDDYGWWEGAKKAVDEYILENNIKIFLSRVDYTCRVAVKL